MSDQSTGGTQRERETCAFCDLNSDYVLSVSDPAPTEMEVVEDSVPMPICIDHFEKLKRSVDAETDRSGGER